MITIETATRSFDIMTGVFLLTILAVIAVCGLIVKRIEKREQRKTQEAVDLLRDQMTNEFRIEKTKCGAKTFVELFEAKETIKAMERELAEATAELCKIRADYNRLVDIAERWKHGQK